MSPRIDTKIRMRAVQVIGPAQAFIMTIQMKPKSIAINPAAAIEEEAVYMSSDISVAESAFSKTEATEA